MKPSEQRYQVAKHHRRHLRFKTIIAPIALLVLRWRLKLESIPAPPLDGPFLVLANHNSDLDPALVHISFKPYLYFVASEHIFRAGIWSRLLRRYFDPISRLKGSTDLITAREVIRRIRAGFNVCIFAEGNRSFNGLTMPIEDSTAKLAKMTGVPLVTYRLTGGYLTTPRWAKTMRRGKMHGAVVNTYSSAQLKAMSVAEVHQAILQDLHEDAYERQAREMIPYKGKRLAEWLETTLFLCPSCERFDTLTSNDDKLACTCGLEVTYDVYGFLQGGPYRTIRDWDAWQHEKAKQLLQAASSDPLFSDQTSHLKRIFGDHESELLHTGSLAMYKDRLVAGDHIFSMAQISNMNIVGRNRLVFTHAHEHYEITGPERFCGRRYFSIYTLEKQRGTYEQATS